MQNYNRYDGVRHGNAPTPDIFRSDALTTRFGGYPCTVNIPCTYPNSTAFQNAPTSGTSIDPKGDIGMGVNNDILNYQFLSMQDSSFCGVPLTSEKGQILGADTPANCAACPCQKGTVMGDDTLNSGCDYGFARTMSSIMGPNAGNKNGLNRWG